MFRIIAYAFMQLTMTSELAKQWIYPIWISLGTKVLVLNVRHYGFFTNPWVTQLPNRTNRRFNWPDHIVVIGSEKIQALFYTHFVFLTISKIQNREKLKNSWSNELVPWFLSRNTPRSRPELQKFSRFVVQNTLLHIFPQPNRKKKKQ